MKRLLRKSVSKAGLAAVGLGYLYGSIPFIHLLAERRRVDLKDVGSGNVGATNLWTVAGAPAAALGWALDASKGLLPVLAARRLGVDEEWATLAGVGGVAGQCWPAFLGFNGGRGISAYVGATFAMDRGAWLGAILPLIGGSLWRVVTSLGPGGARSTAELKATRSKSVPLASFVSVLVFPVVYAVSRRRVLPAVMLLPAVILARRLTAPLPDDVVYGPEVEPPALLYRLLYDRNTAA